MGNVNRIAAGFIPSAASGERFSTIDSDRETWRQADYRDGSPPGFEEITFHPTPSPATLIFAR